MKGKGGKSYNTFVEPSDLLNDTGFELYYKAMVIETVWYQHNEQIHRPMEYIDQSKSPETPMPMWPINI